MQFTVRHSRRYELDFAFYDYATVVEFKAAFEPLIMTFFQLGIVKIIMIGYRFAGPLPIRGL